MSAGIKEYHVHFMGSTSRHHLWLVIVLTLAGVALPFIGYWWLIGRAPSMSTPQARRMVDAGDAVLVDVGRDRCTAVTGINAVHWPLQSLRSASAESDVPVALRGRKLLLICRAGVSSAIAALHLRAIGVNDAFSVRGGVQEWIASSPGCPRSAILHGSPAVDATIPAFRSSPLFEQWTAVLTFFGVKLIYTIISAAVAVALWRQTEPDLAAIRWAMVFFFIGEACCFVNVMAFREHATILEHLHSVGMVLAFAFTTYALLEGIDQRLVHFGDEKNCVAAGLCRGCIKHADVACGFRRMFLLVVPATALLAAIPLFSTFRDTAYNTRVFGILQSYRHPVVHQIYELRYLPILAIALLTACFLVLLWVEKRPVPISKILFSAGAGAIGFSLFRLVFVASFVENQVWYVAWEETTELLYVCLVGGILIIFRRGLLTSSREAH